MLQLWFRVLYNFNIFFSKIELFLRMFPQFCNYPSLIKQVQHALYESVELSYYYYKHYFFAIDTPFTVLGDKPHVNLWVFSTDFWSWKKCKQNENYTPALHGISILLVICKYDCFRFLLLTILYFNSDWIAYIRHIQ